MTTVSSNQGESAYKGANVGHLTVTSGCNSFGEDAFQDATIDSMYGHYSSTTLLFGEASFKNAGSFTICLLYTSPSPRDRQKSRMPSSA